MQRKGVIFGLLGAFSFGLMGFLAHCLGKRVPVAEISFFRSLLSFAVLFPIAWKIRDRLVRRESIPIWIRSLAGAISVLCYFSNLQSTGVGKATALADLSPVFVALISWLIFSERLRTKESFALVLAVGGAFSVHLGDLASASWGVVSIGTLGALLGSIAYVSLRRASVKFSSSVVVCCFSGVTMAVAAISNQGDWFFPSAYDCGILSGVAVCGLLGQVYMTKSYMHLKASIACGISVSALLWGMSWDAVLHQEYPLGSEWIAYACLMFGIYLLQSRPSLVVATKKSKSILTLDAA